MVMEEGPSPQSVGREFVRQYYTLLNKAPLHLHRFYNNDSSFTHGGLSSKGREVSPVFGQQDIHRKIVELDFRDCKAKILSVDAQHTLGNGVVVQVSGELSNNGQPMRRFMQTFVLAPQSAKKYYVRNDVFRYQDEVFSDDDESTDVDHPEPELEVKPQVPAVASYTEATEAPATVNVETAPAAINGPNTQEQEEIRNIPFTQSNGPPTPELSATTPPSEDLPPATTETIPTQTELPSPPEPVEPEKKVESPPAPHVPTTTGKSVELTSSPPVVTNEPKTYANLLKTSGAFTAASPGFPTSAPVATATRNTTSTPPVSSAVVEAAPAGSVTGNGDSGSSFQPGQPQRFQRPVRPGTYGNGRGGMPVRGNRDRFDRDRDERAESRNSAEEGEWRHQNGGENYKERDTRRYDDAYQVFVGNIPHSETEENLKDLFEQFGKVVEVKIQVKPNARTASGSRAPNYGFVIFDSVAAAEAALKQKPVLLNGHHRLNVEPKRHGGSANAPSGFRPTDQRGPVNRSGGMGGPMRGGRMGGGPGGMAGGPPRTGMGGGQGGRGGYTNRRQ